MAGRGPAPKLPSERRNQNPKLRGEWVDLPPVTHRAPALPKGAEWPPQTRRAWKLWWADPASTQWGPADLANVEDLVRLHAAMVPATAAEVRLRMDSLGLTQRGKRDLRWRVPADETNPVVTVEAPMTARRERLRVVDAG